MAIPGSFHALTSSSVRVKIVDIGANPLDAVPQYNTLLRGGHADIIGFEPNTDALAKLNGMKGPNETYLPNAIGDGKRHTLNLCASSGMTSLLTPNTEVLNLFHGFPNWGQVVSKIEVETTRLDDIPETEGIDFVKIDIQGAELMVFQNATKRLADALVIQTEVEFLPLYVDQPLFGDVDVFLRSQGYAFHRFFPTVSRTIVPMLVQQDIYAGLSQTVWADAVYVRNFTRLSRLSPRQLLAMAAILHDCYQSYDLVLHILLEHDRRTGEKMAPTYMTGLTGQAAAPAAG
ncbi:FkbM family methyltransferase [Ferrovibrio terrae]|uniref:FkbM family methyltransferase n=1 Tax=Ferrovibrio terrae TaxID=2594003 RepID=A0A516H5M3_9PROT|nr:FkbM family methyltransferase [Ferrovibrio terrae]QDO99099.1 FkbM family methyltransferase [Ferrovibrio terrae]